MIRNEGERLKRVIVCAPAREYFTIEDPGTHNIEQPAAKDKAVEQHRRLRSIMQAHGVQVINVAEMERHPNSVFIRDTCVCVHGGFIQLRMGLASRRGEEEWTAAILRDMGMEMLGQVREPGTIEGGDIILAGSVAFIGRSARSNEEGVMQVKAILEDLGYEVRVAAVPPSRLHVGGMMSMIGPRRIMCCAQLFVEDFFRGFQVVKVPADDFVSGNVICLDENVVIAETGNTPAVASLENAGVHVHPIDLSEFVKGRGGPTCLIMPVARGDG